MNNFFARMGIVGELFQFLWARKLYWLVPMIIALVVFGAIIALGAANGAMPFIYTLF